MPAEWAPHAATWLSWPHKEASWPGNFEPIPAIWVEMVRALTPGEHVNILVLNTPMQSNVRAQLSAAGVNLDHVSLHVVPTNDAWARDHGPMFVTNGRELAIIDWIYNAWGGKYPPWEQDDVVPQRVAEILDLPLFEPGVVLEGGSVDVNGAGTVLTTEACLLNPNRNPHLKKAEIEAILASHLGVRNVLWLGDGIVGDDTDGHVDDLTRFVDPTTVVTVVEDDPNDANYAPLQDNLKRLRGMTDQDGQPLRVLTLPMPRPVIYEDQQLPASYANFYIGNSAVLVPIFDDPKDAAALAVLRDCFPTRRVVGISSRELVWGLGAFHCVTQQQPLP